MFYDEFVRLCKEHGVKPSNVADDMGISRGTVSRWKNRGVLPSAQMIESLCHYFGCEVTEFFPNTKKDPVNKDEVIEEIDRLFTSLPPEKQSQALEFLKFLSGSQGK